MSSEMKVVEGLSSRDPHIRNVMLYEYRRGSTASETLKNINEVYPNAVSRSRVYEWFQRFNSGDYSLEDKERSGAPPKVDNDVLSYLIEEDPKMSTREIGQLFEVNHQTIINHLGLIGKRYLAGVWVPHELTPAQKAQRVTICQSLLSRNRREPFLHRIVTGDEKWVLYVNVTLKGQWRSIGQAPIPTVRPDIHQRKVMLCIWWCTKGVAHWELLDIGQTLDSIVYCRQLEDLQTSLLRKYRNLVKRSGVMFHQDNARPHVSNITRQKLETLEWEVMPHPPYSPDIAPSDYHLFRSLQHFLDGKRFNNKESVETAINDYLANKDEDFFSRGINQLPIRWQKIIEKEGEYLINQDFDIDE
ncbi:histone-lysine N-methyltransferase SETMAR-like [Oppia nitens]|uniref:histone-lysine N-methyltransferase SETMAR-like n=1 Tax=Oppia nitens TaxID=1686743 RepID=UPI0023DB3A57|nr:histone-lysine N-methyltransferase SETMAR-like [Oppia nitens]